MTDFQTFIRPENSQRCRACDAGEPRDAPPRKLHCFFGETAWPNGARRAVVIFVCLECEAWRYLDLATELPAGVEGARPALARDTTLLDDVRAFLEAVRDEGDAPSEYEITARQLVKRLDEAGR